jgi:peptidoglycan/xylan/chitin deacetylase (PgdA/CDA1 family)
MARPPRMTATIACAGLVMPSLLIASDLRPGQAERRPTNEVSALRAVETEVRFPIFNYHHLSPLPTNASPSRVTFTVTPELFEQHLKYWKEQGRQIVSLDALTDYFDRRTPLPPKAMAITFDDGWKDQYEFAFPLLKKYGFQAAFFVPVGWIGHPTVMSWSNLREMADAGMTIGTHGFEHLHFDQIDENGLKKEIVDGKVEMEKQLGREVRYIAYPGGHWTTQAVAIVKSGGYKAAFGVDHRLIQSPKHRYDARRFHADNNMESITQPLITGGY